MILGLLYLGYLMATILSTFGFFVIGQDYFGDLKTYLLLFAILGACTV